MGMTLYSLLWVMQDLYHQPVDDIYIYISCITLMTLDYGRYGLLLIIGSAGFISSTVVSSFGPVGSSPERTCAQRV